MRTSVFLTAILLAFAPAVSAGAERSVTVKIAAMNGTGESGIATFIAQGDKTLVVVDLTNAPGLRQPSHLHDGTCDDYSPAPAYPLADVVGGKSRTIVNERFEKIVSGRYILNVHKSYDDIATQAACSVVKG
ncbi:MAG TPA: hypothetical protein VFL13_06800 [Candidatus Baltobacteraceae bacterium]|nr:hypothetical protein [Candidatus Baltobacteraceae bacterium]